MERSSIKLMAAAMVISVMLAGCGAKEENTSSADSGAAANQGINGGQSANQGANGGQAANQGANGGQAANQGTDSSGNGPQQPDRTADYFAKVVKVSGDSVIVQKSTTSPADMPSFGGGRGGGQRPQGGDGAQGGDGTQGQGTGGGQRGNWQKGGGAGGQGGQGQAAGGQGTGGQAADGQAGGGQAADGQGANAQGGTGGRPGGRPGGGGFANLMKFADEQVTVPVNADTAIVKMGRGQNGVTTDTLKATDLQAGDILMVWLGSDNKTAQYIRLQINPANFGNTGKAGNGQ